MAKSKLHSYHLSPAEYRRDCYQYYLNKYYALFINNFKVKDLDYQQVDFIFRKMWADGRIACFQLARELGANPNSLVFTPFAPNGWNIYDYPTSVTLINTRGVTFIPTKPMIPDEDVVLGWAQRNKKSVKEFVEFYVEKITNVEVIMNTHLNQLKRPYVFVSNPEDEKVMKEIFDSVMDDNPDLYIPAVDSDKVFVLNSNVQYVMDKLYNYKCSLENELREFLGLDNLGVNEKKEHLISNEIEANNEVTSQSKNNFMDSMTEFFDRINILFGTNLVLELNRDEVEIDEDEFPNEEEEQVDETSE